MRARGVLLAGLALAAAAAAGAQPPASRLLVLDQDAGSAAPYYGALLNVDLLQPPGALPAPEASAAAGAPFEFLSGLVISPFDGRAYVSDLRIDVAFPLNTPGAIYAVDGRTGAVSTVSNDAALVDPWNMTFLPDGRLVIVDWESDPSGLGPDEVGGLGHGGLFWLDSRACAPPCPVALLADGTVGTPYPGIVTSAFQDPTAVAYDPVTDSLYVVDLSADPLGLGHTGAIYRVDPDTGYTDLVASSDQFLAPLAIALRDDGTPLVVDAFPDDSVVWEVDVANPDPTSNVTLLTGGIQYALLEGIGLDDAGNVFLVDSGEWDAVTMTYLRPPLVHRVDEGAGDPLANSVVVHDSLELAYPVGVFPVPVPQPLSVSPRLLTVPTDVVLSGTRLVPSLELDFGPEVAVSNVVLAPGVPTGTALELTLTPLGLPVPAGCGPPRPADLLAVHPFGTAGGLIGAVDVAPAAPPPRAPCSARGDANCDGFVDGLDLAVLGRHFTAVFCDVLAFAEDADFDDDGMIDGSDLAILATWFGGAP